MKVDDDESVVEDEFSICETEDLEDEQSLIDSLWFMPTPKSTRSDCYAFTSTIADYNAKMLESIDIDSLDDCIDGSMETYSIVDLLRGHRKLIKLQKTKDYRPMAIAHLSTKEKGLKPKPIKVLFDSGGSHCLVAVQHVKKLKHTTVVGQTWTTPAGKMSTSSTVNGKFTLPEFHDGRTIEWKLHVTENLGACDMIIGRDLMQDLGIDVRLLL